jgi:hypothetical protein
MVKADAVEVRPELPASRCNEPSTPSSDERRMVTNGPATALPAGRVEELCEALEARRPGMAQCAE